MEPTHDSWKLAKAALEKDTYGNETQAAREAQELLYSIITQTCLRYLSTVDVPQTYVEDYIQATAMRVFKVAEGLDERYEIDQEKNFDGYVYSIVRNLFLDNLRKSRRRVHEYGYTEDEAEYFIDPVSLDETDFDIRVALGKGLDSLEPIHREAWDLVYVQGMKWDEAAQSLGIEVNTFKSRLARAREKMTIAVLQINLTSLPTELFNVWQLTHVEKLSLPIVANRLSITKEEVRERLSKAKQELENLLRENRKHYRN